MINSVKNFVSELWPYRARLGVYLASFIVIEVLFSLLLFAKNAAAAETFARSFVVAFLASSGLIIFGFYTKNVNISFLFSLLLLLGVVLICINEPVAADASFLESIRDAEHIIVAVIFTITLSVSLRIISGRAFEKPLLICAILCSINALIYSILFLFGNDTYGVKVSFMGINLCEITKVIYIIALAYLFSDSQFSYITRLKASLAVLSINCFALFLLSELGTACIMMAVFLIAQLLFGQTKHTLIVFISFFLIMLLGILTVLWLHNRSSMPQIITDNIDKIYYRLFSSSSSYQMEKALLASLNGGMLGATDFNVDVPIIESDFIVVALVQRFGLVFFIAYIIGLSLILVMCCRAAYEKTEQEYNNSMMFVFAMLGLFSVIIQSICSILMAFNCFPIIGICNPLIDAHGSNLMVTSGIIVCVLQGLNRSGRSEKGEKREKIHRIKN